MNYSNFHYHILIISGLVLNVCSLYSQENYGFADKSTQELSQFEYYRGKWTTQMEMKQEDGTFKKLDFTSTITGKYLEDHKTFQIEFSGSNDFFSTDIRTYDTIAKKWRALFLNAKAQRWHNFTSKIVNDKMTTIVLGGYSGKEKFDVKIIDTIISENNYLKYVYYSIDGMKTWQLVYKINVTKIGKV